MYTIDINCDMGEGAGNDEALMPFISSANITCGYHAGDTDTIRSTMRLCRQHGIAVGAHPSFFDRENFGRTAMTLEPAALADLIGEQLLIFAKIADEEGCAIHHVKPHGALYNMAALDIRMATTIAETIAVFNNKLVLYGLSGSSLLIAGQKAGLKTAAEVFADRTYQSDGSLTPRQLPNAVIADESVAIKQALDMVTGQRVTTENGTAIPVQAETICIHGDNPHAVMLAKAIYKAFTTAQIQIAAI